jgi:hypothetical protein
MCPNATEIGLSAATENIFECIPFLPAGLTHLRLISDILYNFEWFPPSGEWVRSVDQLCETLCEGPNGPLRNLKKLTLDARGSRYYQFDHSIADAFNRACSTGGIEFAVFVEQFDSAGLLVETSDAEEDESFSDSSEFVQVS